MSTLKVNSIGVLATAVRFEHNHLCVQLSDGREISAPLEWFPKLRDATREQRNNWRLIGGGIGIHWEKIDEDISVAGLLRI
ncbi:MAG: DUF2442 domain-containing protein [Planctomycetota bacterium]